MIRYYCGLAVLIVASLLCAGCADDKPKIVPVSGQVLIDGKPLTHGYIRFAPLGNRPAIGRIDPDGRFTLTCYKTGDGAMVGSHRIAIMSQEPVDGTDRVKWHAPRRYASYTTSGLIQEITEPTDSLVIQLTWGNEQPTQ